MNQIFKYIIFLLFIFVSCEEAENPIPIRRVYLTLDLTFEDKDLKAIPSYKAFTVRDVNLAQGESVGFGGVLVVHDMLGAYKAFDLACAYEVRQDVTVQVDNEVLYAVCPVCGTQYDVGTGNGAPNGKSRHYLRMYSVRQDANKLIVSN
ncbi:MAG: (2Fe-2S)-binding protein [Tannerella sp.]|jgi:nitrite reductase/ring-hydroxylating ferredoxin subunit|nr:(2Fe-2S)-binding protein [Tannerella sp.]